MSTREKLSVIVAEFFGTAVLATVALAVGQFFEFTAAWYISTAVAITLAVMVGTIGKVTGAHINPAVTIGLWTLKKIPTANALVYVSSQLLGGAVALALFEYLTNGSLQASSASFEGRVFVAEMLGTAVFGFGIAAVVTQKLDGFQAAFTIGASLMLGVLVASLASKAFINPAVALAHNSWDRTYAVAPILGSVVGMNLYAMLLAPESSIVASRKKK